MSERPKVPIRGAIYGLLAIALFVAMYVAYRYVHRQQEFEVAIGVLGVIAGMFLAKASTARTEFLIAEMSGAALIREKLNEAKTLEGLREQYRKDLKDINAIVKAESSRLFLLQLRETRAQEAQDRLHDIETIDNELKTLQVESTSPQVVEIRKKFSQILATVGSGSRDIDLIRELIFTVPIGGQYLYIAYLMIRRLDPSIDGRLATAIRSIMTRLDWTSAELKAALKMVMWCLLGVILLVVFLGANGVDESFRLFMHAK